MSMVNPLAEHLELYIVLSSQDVTIVLPDIVGTENHKRHVLASYCTGPLTLESKGVDRGASGVTC